MKTEEEELFNSIFRKYHRDLYVYLCGKTGGDNEAAMDLMNDVWEVLLQKFETVAYGEEYLKGWLFQTAENKAKNYMRRKSTWNEIPTEEELLLNQMSDMPFFDVIERLTMEEFIKSLLPIEQKVLLLRLEGKSYREISRNVKRSEQALQCIHYRAVKKLQGMMMSDPEWC
ncbi:MAG: sigma-70 family RNA polymerase sigma factor [Fusicatenibacter sp.]|nr:sigma-70 family RNA polymerase sigma factor [Fusicatenibacter sp.]MDY2938106.1 sigma-70 family RNA polymerase sigma factor [Fusicatenibacter sp.]